MPASKACRRLLQALLGLLAWAVAASAAADPSAASLASSSSSTSSWLTFEAGLGVESQTSPLFQITPDSTVIYIGGLQRLGGTHLRTSVQGFADWPLEEGTGISLAGDATIKQSPSAPDFDVRTLSLQPSFHLSLGASSVGVGVSLQRLDVAGRHFRDTHSIQANWTYLEDKSLWALIADIGINRHKGELADLNARTSALVLKRQFSEPINGVDNMDLSVILGQERNDHGFQELSHRSAMLHATIQWSVLGLQWSAGRAWRQARFEASAFSDETVRNDRTIISDLSAEWNLTEKKSLRLEVNTVRNVSTIPLYNNDYRQLSVMFRRLM